ncbi:MAG: apolipoprotein N-acyltransferase [Alphaproteobacteria bacterium CG_4_9_14_3_um_filter_47_13]|nr:MAG: apolipoprotein N-acyltransferase [Alphaproteobacteria bacterium CG_4_9_14_3_um_filter_47_13]
MNIFSPTDISEKILLWPVRLKALLAFIAGAIMVAGMPPWCIWPALFAGFGLFYIILSTVTKIRMAFLYGWLFGFGYFTVGLIWIGNALLVEDSQYALFWPLAVAGLPAFLAFFTAFATSLTVRFSSLKTISGYLLFTSMIMAFEWLRGHIFTGFPWNLYGYTWTNTLPMAQIASIGGIYLLSFATCAWATLPGFLLIWHQKRFLKILLATALLLDMGGAYLYGVFRLKLYPTQISEDTIVRLVQPNITQEDKWNPAKGKENLEKILLLSEAESTNSAMKTILVWPETAISNILLRDNWSHATIRATLGSYPEPVFLLAGTMRIGAYGGRDPKYHNSLTSYDRRLNVQSTHDKVHLVPFGEYIPLQKYIPLEPLVNFSGFEKGKAIKTAQIPQLPYKFSALVCYEIIFPGAVVDEKNRPDFIVNVTNDAWYGDSAGPRQHFAHAVFRAIEEGIPVIRAANTGISGVIDPTGRIIHKIPLDTPAGVNVSLPKKLVDTPYYTSLKDSIFFIILGLFSLISVLYQLYKKNYIK